MAYQMGSGDNSGGVSGCTEDYEGCGSHHGKKTYQRHTPEQIQRLEGFYKECPLQDRNQRCLLGMELGLEPRQIKIWFQNKRTQMKVQSKRLDNNSLRLENDRIQSENNAIREALKKMVCHSCGGLPVGEEENKQIIKKLLKENKELNHEFGRVFDLLAKSMGRPLSGATCNAPDVSLAGPETGSPAPEVDFLAGKVNADSLDTVYQMNAQPELEKLLMIQTAASAMDELIKLLSAERPFWIKCPEDEHYDLDYDSYDKKFPRPKKHRYLKSRMESSKYSDIVVLNARLLVDVFLNPDMWVDFFPTVFSKARTVHVLEAGLLENRNGCLQLIYEQMLILSPLIPPREYNLLQHCQEIQTGVWVIVAVSYNCFGGCLHDSSTCCWKHPSGWMIQEMPNGISKVTCIEHVEVDGFFQIHPIYEDLVKSTVGFGAKRWIKTLQKTFELFSYLMEAVRPVHVFTEGRRSMIMLARRMIKNYCSIFCLFETANVHQLSKLESNRVKIAVWKNTAADLPVGTVISAASSFWVPASPLRVFDYLSDHMTRSQWDVLCKGNPVSEMIRIPTGSHPANAISILRPLNPDESSILIFQESMMGPYESLIVYAPIDAYNMIKEARGMNTSTVPILASGFAIIPNGPDARAAPSSSRSNSSSGGSLITVAFQILACSSLNTEDVGDKPSMATEIVSRVVHVIEAAFNVSS